MWDIDVMVKRLSLLLLLNELSWGFVLGCLFQFEVVSVDHQSCDVMYNTTAQTFTRKHTHQQTHVSQSALLVFGDKLLLALISYRHKTSQTGNT